MSTADTPTSQWKPIEQTVNGSLGYGNRVSSTVSRNGDLVGKMYLEYVQSGNDATATANPGTALIDNVEVEIGGQKIDKHYGHWMETWFELTEPNATGANPTHADVAVNSTSAYILDKIPKDVWCWWC